MRKAEILTDLLLVVKTVVATSAAWWISVTFLASETPFLAPWIAMMAVQPTVASSLARGGQTLIASGIGVVMSFAIGAYLGVGVWSYALAIFVGLLGARIPGLRREGIAISTTAIFLLSAGFSEDTAGLVDRTIEVGVGVVIGVGINLVVFPPLRDQRAALAVDNLSQRMAKLMAQMGEELSESWASDQAHSWSAEVSEMRRDVDQTWREVQFARESRRRNPRRLLRSGRPENLEDQLLRLDEGIAHLRHLTRILETDSYSESAWDDNFREQWAAALSDAAARISDPEAGEEPIADRLDRLARGLAKNNSLPEAQWPLYGALITAVRNISLMVEDVAAERKNEATSGESPS